MSIGEQPLCSGKAQYSKLRGCEFESPLKRPFFTRRSFRFRSFKSTCKRMVDFVDGLLVKPTLITVDEIKACQTKDQQNKEFSKTF